MRVLKTTSRSNKNCNVGFLSPSGWSIHKHSFVDLRVAGDAREFPICKVLGEYICHHAREHCPIWGQFVPNFVKKLWSQSLVESLNFHSDHLSQGSHDYRVKQNFFSRGNGIYLRGLSLWEPTSIVENSHFWMNINYKSQLVTSYRAKRGWWNDLIYYIDRLTDANIMAKEKNRLKTFESLILFIAYGLNSGWKCDGY